MLRTRTRAATPRPSTPGRLALRIGALASLSALAGAQTTFSIDVRAAQKGAPDSCTGIPITEGDILGPVNPTHPPCVSNWPTVGPLPIPSNQQTGGPGGLGLPAHPAAVGLPPGMPGMVEIDALSYGRDGPALPGMPPGSYWFSVDGVATGVPTAAAPSVFTEGAFGAREAAGDVFTDIGLPPPPVPPGAVPPGNVGAIDGNGLLSATPFAYPGLGLLEPMAVPPPPIADTGDNLDAVDVDGPETPFNGGVFPIFSPTRTYFSLDGPSAVANGGFSGADVLFSFPGGPPMLFAPGPALGLDLALGPNTDNLDAVAVFKVIPGPIYAPSMMPFDWLAGAADMVLFSVAPGSAVVGMPDSIFGIPISPGDILTAPLPVALGGLSPFPGIFVAAENVGLSTFRAGFNFDDNLDALDVVCKPVLDCDANGVEDALDLLGGAPDGNMNGLPDMCEIAGAVPPTPPFTYCTGKTNSLNCIPFMSWSGTPSAGAIPGAFRVQGNDVMPADFGLLLYGYSKANLSFHFGKLCVKGPMRILPPKTPKAVPWGCTGAQLNRNFNKTITSGSDPMLTAGKRVFVQWLQRDPANPLGFGDNLTDGMSFVINP